MTTKQITIPAAARAVIDHAVEGLRLANAFDPYSLQRNFASGNTYQGVYVAVYGAFRDALHQAVQFYWGHDAADEFLDHLSATGETPEWYKPEAQLLDLLQHAVDDADHCDATMDLTPGHWVQPARDAINKLRQEN